jgi:hypothetical protein
LQIWIGLCTCLVETCAKTKKLMITACTSPVRARKDGWKKEVKRNK